MKIRLLSSCLLGLSGILLTGTVAYAQTSIVERAAEGLKKAPVYVDPEAESVLRQDEAQRLSDQIERSDAGPVYIAVLPEEVLSEGGGSLAGVIGTLGQTLNRSGTYVVVAGTQLLAGTSGGTQFEEGTVPELASLAVQSESGNGASAVLTDFVDRLEASAAAGGSLPQVDTPSTPDGGGGGFGLLPLLLVGGGIAFIISLRRRRAAEQREHLQLEEVKGAAMDDLVALGTDLRTLDLDVEMPDADPAAKDDYVHALGCYEKASQSIDDTRRPEDLEAVSAELEEGRWAMTSAKARLKGLPPPERRPPCFFDPRHGPSVQDVDWAPSGGAPRAVPACGEDAERIRRGEEPMAREITVGGRMTPYWNAPAYYGPWAGGYFGGMAGGFFPGLFLGSMLGGGFGYGGDYGGDGGGDYGGGDGGGDGGDFGGGDFGG
ncbi:MAG: hypothetical protein M3333_05670, partial [Actinomycetota bacterium]|nr:hypothetical protein [Actinomycetota bacterium]